MTRQPKAIAPVERPQGYGLTRFNALRHGILSRYTVLPWEDIQEYEALLRSLAKEHRPEGPTEEHLVEELAGIVWRKRRLRLAEAAAHRRGLKDAAEPFRETAHAAMAHTGQKLRSLEVLEAVSTTETQATEESRDLDAEVVAVDRALELLRSGKRERYQAARKSLPGDILDWWKELDQAEESYTDDPDGLVSFLESEVQPWLKQRRQELDAQPIVAIQALGESLDPNRLERLSRYEVHLDRKLERMLSMLVRLQEIRHRPGNEEIS